MVKPQHSEPITRISMKLSFAFLLLALLPAGADTAKPLQVYILAGQSNMQGHAQVRTFERLRLDSESKPLLELMADAEGKPRPLPRG